ncbi:hypothetical protein ACU684_13740 [Pseudomonas sp. LF135]|jgi:hypothetical protein|uniref:hypothetical protein n=1 Tax=Pseudomonas TaxID=286 RepID=UPI000D0C9941|nr:MULTISPECIES: hypothetical protein [Pseudomonas]MBT0625680.1 hypothetical protein [Pseudomonas fluorescens]PSL92662.1 hypothetical protein C7U57_17820 [Pseudomonas sp. R9.37]
MNTDSRVLSSLYRQQSQAEKNLDQISADIPYSEGSEDSARLFEQLIEEKSALVNNFAVSSTYLSYKHETVKSAINVV